VDEEDKKKLKGADQDGWTKEYVVREVLLGITICFAQIPESVAFAFMAHVKPPIALHAAWIVGLICSLFGGRPGMVNGATGAFAAIIGTFIPNAGTGKNGEGVELLFPSVMLAGVLMFVVSATKLSRFITLLPSPVMIGFCNGLAFVIGLAQLHPFKDPATHGWKTGSEMVWMLIICFASMATMEFLPKLPLKIFKVVPSSLMAIIISIVLEFAVVRPLGSRTDTIRDVSEFTSDTAIPIPFFMKTTAQDYDLSTITTSNGMTQIGMQGLLLCVVGVIESLMTSEVVEAFTKTPSDGDRTVLAMGAGNLISGFLGGMGGNAMIGLSTVNCLNGGKGRLGPTCTALGIMACVLGAYPLLNFIPVAALAGVMLVVVLHTFKWFSLQMLLAALLPLSVRNRLGLAKKVPRFEVAVIFVVAVLANWPAGTNIAYAVCAGLAMCSVFYAWNSASMFHVTSTVKGDVKFYDVSGPLFFASGNNFKKMMNPDNDPDTVEVRFADNTSVMDFSAMDVLHKVSLSYKGKQKSISFKSLCPQSTKMINKSSVLTGEIVYSERSDRLDADAVQDPLAARMYEEVEAGVAGGTIKEELDDLEKIDVSQGLVNDPPRAPRQVPDTEVIGKKALEEIDLTEEKEKARAKMAAEAEQNTAAVVPVQDGAMTDEESQTGNKKGKTKQQQGCLFCAFFQEPPASISKASAYE